MMPNNWIFLKLSSAHAEITNKFSLQPLHQYLIVQSKTILNIYEFISFLIFWALQCNNPNL